MTPDNVIPLHDPKEDCVYELLYEAYINVIEQVYEERGKIDDKIFDLIAYQAAAETLGYLEGRLVRRGYIPKEVDWMRQRFSDLGLVTEIDIHKEQCTIPDCDAPKRFEVARKRYAKAVAEFSEGPPRASLWATLMGWIKSVGRRQA